MLSRVRSVSLLMSMLLVLAVTACSSSNKSSSNSGSSNNSGSSSSGSSNQAASGKKLSACDYAGQVFNALATFGFNDISASGDASATKSTVTSIVDSAKQSLSDLKAITPPDDFKQFHADFVSAIQNVVNQLQDAQKSVDAGDSTKALATLGTATSSFSDQAEKLQQKYSGLTQKLDACASPTP